MINALANDPTALAIGGTRQVASWNASGSATIDTNGATAGCSITRPNGSSDGRTAFHSSLVANDGCLQGARASALSLGALDENLVYIPFASEGISFATTKVSNFPKNLTLTELRAIFNCTAANLAVSGPYTGDGSLSTNKNYRAMIPQNGSGTRSYWTGQMNMGSIGSSGTITGKECVQNGADENTASIQERNGTQLNNFELVPFSVAQFQSQIAGVISTDVTGPIRIGQIDGKNPFATDFGLVRDVYNAFAQEDVTAVNPAAGTVAHAIKTLFVGPTAQICTNAAAQAIILRYGLRAPVLNPCGDTSNVTA